MTEPFDRHRPTAVETRDIPVVPESTFERLRQYQNVREANFCGWAPDGRGILIRTRFAQAEQLHRVHEPGGRREQLTFQDEPVGGRFIPGGIDGMILFVLSRGGNENYQIFRLEPASGRTVRLTDGVSRNTPGPILHDGSRMVVSSNSLHPREMDLYLADPRGEGSTTLLLASGGHEWRAYDWTRDARSLLLNRIVSIHETYPAMLDVAARALHPIPPPVPGVCAFADLALAPDGRHAYVCTDARGEFQELARISLDSFRYEWLTAEIPWDVSDIKVDSVTGRVAFTTNENGASRLHLLHDERHVTVPSPPGVIRDLEFSPDGAQLGFTLARSDAPPDVYSVSVSDLAWTRWTHSELGGLDSSRFISPVTISYPSFDGRDIPAFYMAPGWASKERPAPVLIRIHGGPESQVRPTFAASDQVYLNELGLAILCPNVRGSAGYGKTYLSLDNAEKREDSVKDIGALLDWIATRPELDSTRVGVSGGSYGGYMVLASLIHFGDRIRAGIERVGIANFVTFLEKTSAYRQDLRRAEYGDERDPRMREILERISPTARAEEIRSALLIAHGANDPRVPLYEAEQIAEKLRQLGRQVWTLYALNEGHSFSRKENMDYLTAVSVMFLQQHLLDGEADSIG